MATMRFKNKYDVAFKQMVLEAKKVHGIPKEIVVSPMEMWGVINEMRWSDMSESQFRVKSLTDSNQEFTNRRMFWSAYSDMAKEEANVVINQIIRGEFVVNYAGIPLRIKHKPEFTNPGHAGEPGHTASPDVPTPAGPISTEEKPNETVLSTRPKPKFPENEIIYITPSWPGFSGLFDIIFRRNKS